MLTPPVATAPACRLSIILSLPFSPLPNTSKVFYTAAVLFADYKLCQWRCNQLPINDEEGINAIWSSTHKRNARFLLSTFLGLEGLWVKLGQYLSSRADVMPQEYLDVLGKCQDSLPARKFDDIKALVEAELCQPLSAVFDHVDEEPIACASIAQVRPSVA